MNLELIPDRHMQDCFRKYPEIYGSELADDAEDGDKEPRLADAGEPAPKQASSDTVSKFPEPSSQPVPEKLSTPPVTPVEKDKATEKVEQVKEEALKVAEEVVPTEAHDATKANERSEDKKQ